MVFYFLLKLNIPEGPEYETTTLNQSTGESLTQYKDSWCEIQVLGNKKTYQNSVNVHNFLNTLPGFT